VLAMDAQEGEHLVHIGSIPGRGRVYRMSWSPYKTDLTWSRIDAMQCGVAFLEEDWRRSCDGVLGVQGRSLGGGHGRVLSIRMPGQQGLLL